MSEQPNNVSEGSQPSVAPLNKEANPQGAGQDIKDNENHPPSASDAPKSAGPEHDQSFASVALINAPVPVMEESDGDFSMAVSEGTADTELSEDDNYKVTPPYY